MVHPSGSQGLEHRESGIGPRSLAAAAVLKGVAALIGRAAKAAEAMVASFLLWQQVSREVERLLLLPDATLKRMGLERNQIAPTVYRAAWDDWDRRRAGALPPEACHPGTCCRDPLP